ncbi:hypothetical protein TRIUR3_00863 [Triticum urartu]|uniref:Mediator complex subunit 15 KIX domain-containing protein n=1 Tax=Triticum urartu TaxID=4572 RepID=M7ZHV6_TRIUA|nr:hypothetical protein TRIUR3_00863 [Triticum urartu]
METLKNRLPVSVSVAPEALNELQKIAAWFEQKVYTEATSQYDYLRKISLKLLSMETQRQQAAGNAQLIPNQNNPGAQIMCFIASSAEIMCFIALNHHPQLFHLACVMCT